MDKFAVLLIAPLLLILTLPDTVSGLDIVNCETTVDPMVNVLAVAVAVIAG